LGFQRERFERKGESKERDRKVYQGQATTKKGYASLASRRFCRMKGKESVNVSRIRKLQRPRNLSKKLG
jgi:hypothetical protein